MNELFYRKKIDIFKTEEFTDFSLIPSKKIRIDDYDFNEGGVQLTLKSDVGEYFSFNCKFKKIEEFLNNFITLKQKQMTEKSETNLPVKNRRNIGGIYDSLFNTLEQVTSGEMEIEKAKAISDIAQTIINAAKLEIQYSKTFNLTNEKSFFLE